MADHSLRGNGLAPATAAAKRGDISTAIERFGKAVLGAEAFSALSAARMDQVRVNFDKAELVSEGAMLRLNPSDVAAVDARTLLVTGAKSPIMFHRLTERLEELLPNCGREVIPDASHIVHEDNAAAFNQAVQSFIEAKGG